MRTVHVVHDSKVSMATIGRAFDAGMRVPDISVSRYHSTIELRDNYFFIKDNGSKFGTLLLLNSPLVLDPLVFAKEGE